MDYRNRAAIVTGASSGIGKAVAIEMAKRGVRTVAIARRENRLRETLEEMRRHERRSEMLVGDVAELGTARAAVSLARERFGRLDFLVNNAGISKRKHLLTVTPEEAEQTIRINLIGPIFFILESLPVMAAQKEGFIVNVSSMAGKLGNPREVVYSASKFGMAGLSETMYFDLHRHGVHTILVNPGPIETEIWEKIESPRAYEGKFYPATDVSDAIFHAIEKRRHEVSVPRHLGIIPVIKALLPALIRRGTDRFDPDRASTAELLARPRGPA